ncbi:MAG: glycosyltransferase family 39 protein [Gammaproteobacteria bacterium]|nr:glycosyltransferase family 39 protein [Gammaproteobacteria bacterium]
MPSRRALLLLGLLLGVLWLGVLGWRDLVPTDEGRYAEIPREMVASGNWVTPYLNGFKYFEKPPLQYWATAIAYELFGQHTWTARLWTALTGFLGVLLCFYAGWRLFGAEAGWYAALVLASSFLYVGLGHINTLDMGTSFFMQLSLVGFCIAQQEAHDASATRFWMLLTWAAMALAMLSKGLIGLALPGSVLVLYSLWQRDWTLWTRLHLGTGLVLFLLIAAPWFVLVSLHNPEFPQYFFIRQHFERYLTRVAGRYQPWWYFIPILMVGILPWLMQMGSVRAQGWRRHAPHGRFDAARVLWLWAVFIFVFFSLSDSKLPDYILPIFPALALLIGQRLAHSTGKDFQWSALLSLLLGITGLALSPWITHLGRPSTPAALYADFRPWVMAAALSVLIGGLLAFVWARKEQVRAAVTALACAWCVGVLSIATGAAALAPAESTYSLAQQVKPHLAPGVPFYTVDRYDQTLPFYLNRTLTLVQYKGELDFGIERAPQKWVPDLARFERMWRGDQRAFAVMSRQLYARLAQQGLPMRVVAQDPRRVVVMKP